jgi:hypothetical protein
MLQRSKCQQKISLDLPHISRVRCNYGGNAKEENNGYAVFISYLWPYDLYGPMIYMAPYIMPLMRENPLRGQVGVGWALEIKTFLGPVKWQQAVR